MGLLERWDQRNQRVFEEHNHRFRAEQAVGGGAGAVGAALAWYLVGRLIGRSLFEVRPWFLGVGLALLVLGVALGIHHARRRAGRRDPG